MIYELAVLLENKLIPSSSCEQLHSFVASLDQTLWVREIRFKKKTLVSPMKGLIKILLKNVLDGVFFRLASISPIVMSPKWQL